MAERREHATATADAGGPPTGGRRRPLLLEPGVLIGLGALLVSVCALCVSIYEASLERHHARAAVWPHVEVTTTVGPGGAFIDVVNSGIGPAQIKTVRVLLDGRRASGWQEVFERLLGGQPEAYNLSSASGRVIRAGDRIRMLELPPRALPPDVMTKLARVGVEVCYASVFEEYWQLRTPQLIGDTSWREIRSCPGAGDTGETF